MTQALSNLTPPTSTCAKEPAYTLVVHWAVRTNAHADAETLRRMLARWIARRIIQGPKTAAEEPREKNPAAQHSAPKSLAHALTPSAKEGH